LCAASLGIPTDVVDATEHLLALADDWAATQDRFSGGSTTATSCSPPASAWTRASVEVVDAHPA